MQRISVLWKSNLIVFLSSFCLMVIELIAARILAPYIGVSLYTWTSIIGIILAGIAIGNYTGGRVADRLPSPALLAAIFFAGSLATIAILPLTLLVTSKNYFAGLPVILNFTMKTICIFFVPATIMSMVSPMVIKLSLEDLKKAGGTVGTIYASSTAGSILGTFMTGFYFILWFGMRTLVWLVAAVLLATGVLAWLLWQNPLRLKQLFKNWLMLMTMVIVVTSYVSLFQLRERWQENYTRESNYYTIRVTEEDDNIKVLALDHLVHSYVKPNDPTFLKYDYLKVFSEIIKYTTRQNLKPSVLHLGGGGYSLPRYMETVYPGSINDVVEIDPAVTEVAYNELGLPRNTSVITYNQDARLFLRELKAGNKYDIVVGDVFNDKSTPYHLTTLEFNRLVKASMKGGGIYLVNIIDNFQHGRYMPSFVYTLQKAFNHVYLISPGIGFEYLANATLLIAATDRPIDLDDFRNFISDGGNSYAHSRVMEESDLKEYLAARKPILLTDDHAPTDILVAELFR